MNALLKASLDSRLREIDHRLTSEARDQLRVNQPEREPTPRVFVPSRSRIES